MKKRGRSQAEAPERKEGEVYGFLLNIRALAAFAVLCPANARSLRVLCVLVEYMNQEGRCRVSRFTLADRLGISRQAVQKHLTILKEWGAIDFKSDSGKLTYFVLDTEGLEFEREGQEDLEEARAARRAQRREARKGATSKGVAPKSKGATSMGVAPSHLPTAAEQNEVSVQPPSVAAAATSISCTGCNPQRLHRVQPPEVARRELFQTSSRESEREAVGAAAPVGAAPTAQNGNRYRIGDRVEHHKFGCGIVRAMGDLEGNGTSVYVEFGNTHVTKKVVSSFLNPSVSA